jgi:hypothetical protein
VILEFSDQCVQPLDNSGNVIDRVHGCVGVHA